MNYFQHNKLTVTANYYRIVTHILYGDFRFHVVFSDLLFRLKKKENSFPIHPPLSSTPYIHRVELNWIGFTTACADWNNYIYVHKITHWEFVEQLKSMTIFIFNNCTMDNIHDVCVWQINQPFRTWTTHFIQTITKTTQKKKKFLSPTLKYPVML